MRKSSVRLNLRQARKERGMTLLDVANIVGVTPGAVSQWESGETIPTFDKVPKLAAALECKIDDLYSET